MPRKVEEITIRGRVFKVGALPATRQLLLLPKVSEVASSVISKAAPLLGVLDRGAELSDVAKLLPSLEELGTAIAEKLPGDALVQFTKDLFALTEVQPLEGGPFRPLLTIMDEELSGETLALLELLWFAVKLNFADFGVGLGALMRKATGPSHSAKSGTSHGQFGASSPQG